MDFQYSGGGMQDWAALALVWGMFVTIFWMVVGWRAMKAHERIADSMQGGPATKQSPPDDPPRWP